MLFVRYVDVGFADGGNPALRLVLDICYFLIFVQPSTPRPARCGSLSTRRSGRDVSAQSLRWLLHVPPPYPLRPHGSGIVQSVSVVIEPTIAAYLV